MFNQWQQETNIELYNLSWCIHLQMVFENISEVSSCTHAHQLTCFHTIPNCGFVVSTYTPSVVRVCYSLEILWIGRNFCANCVQSALLELFLVHRFVVNVYLLGTCKLYFCLASHLWYMCVIRQSTLHKHV